MTCLCLNPTSTSLQLGDGTSHFTSLMFPMGVFPQLSWAPGTCQALMRAGDQVEPPMSRGQTRTTAKTQDSLHPNLRHGLVLAR